MPPEQNPQLDSLLQTADHGLVEQRNTTEAVKEQTPVLEHILMMLNDIKTQEKKPLEIKGANITEIKGDKGDKGESPTNEELTSLIEPLIPAPIAGQQGDRGERGSDPTPEELIALIEPLIPNPIAGKDGDDGYTPQKGVDYFDGAQGERGNDGKDGSPDTVAELIAKLKKKLSIDDLKDVPDFHAMFAKASRGSGGVADPNIPVQDEGVSIGNVRILNFTGSGVSVTRIGDRAIVSITGGGVGSSTPAQQSGVIGGLTNIVTLTNTPITDTLMLYINEGFIDPSRYTLVGLTVTMNTALDSAFSGLRYTAVYQY